MRRVFRNILALALVIVMVCGMSACFAEESSFSTVGSVVTFGRYHQTKEGTDETPIEWIVLDVDEANHRALLISKYVLDRKSSFNEDPSWEKCNQRKWLNAEFLGQAFTPEEQVRILVTDVDNSEEQGYSGKNSPGGKNTRDKIFLLSYAEAKRYFGVEEEDVPGSTENIEARVAPTAYAVGQGSWESSNNLTAEGRAAGEWFLRITGENPHYVDYVFVDGSLKSTQNYGYFELRPALWISLK